MRDDETQRTEDGRLAPLPPNRSLVFYDRRKRARSLVQAPADFVAQLIACEEKVEQFRRARREEPAVGVGRYQAAPTVASGFERQV